MPPPLGAKCHPCLRNKLLPLNQEVQLTLPTLRELRLASHAKVAHRSASREGGPHTASASTLARSGCGDLFKLTWPKPSYLRTANVISIRTSTGTATPSFFPGLNRQRLTALTASSSRPCSASSERTTLTSLTVPSDPMTASISTVPEIIA